MYLILQFFHQWCLFLYWKSKMMTQVFFVSKHALKVPQNMFLEHLYRKRVQWVFQVCNMILGEGGDEERKITFIFIFAIHPLFWSIRRKDEFSLFSTYQMIMDTHSKLILSQDQSKVLSKINIIASFSHMIIKTAKETKENTHKTRPKIACQMISTAPEKVTTHHTGNRL